jgi:hypothetical protein
LIKPSLQGWLFLPFIFGGFMKWYRVTTKSCFIKDHLIHACSQRDAKDEAYNELFDIASELGADDYNIKIISLADALKEDT